MTIDELKGVSLKLAMARQNPEVKFWLDTLKQLADDLIIQEYNASGENAVRALGVQKGIGMCLMLDAIYKAEADKAMPKTGLVVPDKKLVLP